MFKYVPIKTPAFCARVLDAHWFTKRANSRGRYVCSTAVHPPPRPLREDAPPAPLALRAAVPPLDKKKRPLSSLHAGLAARLKRGRTHNSWHSLPPRWPSPSQPMYLFLSLGICERPSTNVDAPPPVTAAGVPTADRRLHKLGAKSFSRQTTT